MVLQLLLLLLPCCTLESDSTVSFAGSFLPQYCVRQLVNPPLRHECIVRSHRALCFSRGLLPKRYQAMHILPGKTGLCKKVLSSVLPGLAGVFLFIILYHLTLLLLLDGCL